MLYFSIELFVFIVQFLVEQQSTVHRNRVKMRVISLIVLDW